MRSPIPFLDLSVAIREQRTEIEAAHKRVLDRGWVLMGPELTDFESQWAEWVHARYAIGVANGLDALRLSLEVVGVRAGDEVIVPSNTYIATWLAVSELGARPVPVEPDEESMVIDPNRVEDAITERTRAILPVHLYGQAADMDAIMDIARRRGIAVVEDAAQAHGATFKGRRIGAHGDAVCWSFYPTKNLGALADAGAITTNREDIADRLKVIRNYGQRRRYVCEVKGWNSRLDEMSAAVLTTRLARLTDWNTRRAAIATRYLEVLSDCGLRLPSVSHGVGHAWHLFVIRYQSRNELQRKLEERGIGTICHYPIPPHLQQAYQDHGYTAGAFPIAERIHDTCLSIPLHPWLDDVSVDNIVRTIKDICLSRGY